MGFGAVVEKLALDKTNSLSHQHRIKGGKEIQITCHQMASLFLMNSKARCSAENVSGDDEVSSPRKADKRARTNLGDRRITGQPRAHLKAESSSCVAEFA